MHTVYPRAEESALHICCLHRVPGHFATSNSQTRIFQNDWCLLLNLTLVAQKMWEDSELGNLCPGKEDLVSSDPGSDWFWVVPGKLKALDLVLNVLGVSGFLSLFICLVLLLLSLYFEKWYFNHQNFERSSIINILHFLVIKLCSGVSECVCARACVHGFCMVGEVSLFELLYFEILFKN